MFVTKLLQPRGRSDPAQIFWLLTVVFLFHGENVAIAQHAVFLSANTDLFLGNAAASLQI